MPEQEPFAIHAAAIVTDKRLGAAELLQELVVDLTVLSLEAKQAHWNVRGPMFRELHLQLDELVDAARKHADILAERCLAMGVSADARPKTLVRDTHLDPFPEGRVPDAEVIDLMVNRLTIVSEVGRRRLEWLGETDPVSQDLVIEALEDLEKQLWMIDSHSTNHHNEPAT